MEIKDFIKKFAETLEVDNVDVLTPGTEFRELDEWSSLAYLSVIAMMDEEYGVQIEEADFKKLRTVQALFEVCNK